jgi:hypothetical protein
MQAEAVRDAGVRVPGTMSLPKRHAEVRLIGMEPPLNQHLLKLLAFDMSAERRAYFRKQVWKWLRDIQAIRLKDSNKPGEASWYYGLLYDGPFGGVEEQNVSLICEGIDDDYEGGLTRNTASIPELVERLHHFHQTLAERAARSEPLLDLAETLEQPALTTALRRS